MPERARQDRPSHPVVARLYDPLTGPVESRFFRPHRAYLVDGIDGRVLDVGTGTGRLLPYLSESTASEVIGIDPDPHMLRQARRRSDPKTALIAADGGTLPFADGSVDVVITSMVLCTVEDPRRVLDEISRVLVASGEFRFFEHVASTGWRRGVQAALAPMWYHVAGGCHLTRDTGDRLRTHPAFEVEEFDRLAIGITPLRPFIRGRLVRR